MISTYKQSHDTLLLTFGFLTFNQLVEEYRKMREIGILLVWSLFDNAQSVMHYHSHTCDKNDLELPENARRWPGIHGLSIRITEVKNKLGSPCGSLMKALFQFRGNL